MAFEFNGQSIETNDSGYLSNHEDWSEDLARAIIKAMSEAWGEKIKQGDVYALFPLDPSKQGRRIAGLPESRRKGGY